MAGENVSKWDEGLETIRQILDAARAPEQFYGFGENAEATFRGSIHFLALYRSKYGICTAIRHYTSEFHIDVMVFRCWQKAMMEIVRFFKEFVKLDDDPGLCDRIIKEARKVDLSCFFDR